MAPAEALAAGKGQVRFLWGCDGKVWYRESEGNAEWQSVEVPAAWKPPTQGFSRCIMTMHHEAPWRMVTGSLWIYFIDTSQNEIHERPLPFVADVPAVLSVLDVFVSDRRVLAMVYPMGKSPYNAVIEADGTLLATFENTGEAVQEEGRSLQRWHTGFLPVSVSADGMLLAGTRDIEDGHAMYSSEIFIADVAAQWVVPLEGAPQGMDPRFSRQGNWIAFAEFNGDLIHVGRVELVK
ncbi:MAG TPA: hypothetical protein VFR10_06675 [bacterium]|nr:hypothetical protein [bacterium]